jgi:hypothetical protein
MKRLIMLIVVLVALLAVGAFVAEAQPGPTRLISIYNVAPGKHLQFLKWTAEREAVDKEIGAPPAQWYVHHNGASWDYISITEVPDPARQAELEKKGDEALKKKGMTTGMAASLEFRQFVSSHTDTFAGGPYTAEELVKAAEMK